MANVFENSNVTVPVQNMVIYLFSLNHKVCVSFLNVSSIMVGRSHKKKYSAI